MDIVLTFDEPTKALLDGQRVPSQIPLDPDLIPCVGDHIVITGLTPDTFRVLVRRWDWPMAARSHPAGVMLELAVDQSAPSGSAPAQER